jgi:hypothetical protein
LFLGLHGTGDTHGGADESGPQQQRFDALHFVFSNENKLTACDCAHKLSRH